MRVAGLGPAPAGYELCFRMRHRSGVAWRSCTSCTVRDSRPEQRLFKSNVRVHATSVQQLQPLVCGPVLTPPRAAAGQSDGRGSASRRFRSHANSSRRPRSSAACVPTACPRRRRRHRAFARCPNRDVRSADRHGCGAGDVARRAGARQAPGPETCADRPARRRCRWGDVVADRAAELLSHRQQVALLLALRRGRPHGAERGGADRRDQHQHQQQHHEVREDALAAFFAATSRVPL